MTRADKKRLVLHLNWGLIFLLPLIPFALFEKDRSRPSGYSADETRLMDKQIVLGFHNSGKPKSFSNQLCAIFDQLLSSSAAENRS